MGITSTVAAKSGAGAFTRGLIAAAVSPLLFNSFAPGLAFVGAAAGSGWGGRILNPKGAAVGAAAGYMFGSGHGEEGIAIGGGMYAGYRSLPPDSKMGATATAMAGGIMAAGDIGAISSIEPLAAVGGVIGGLINSKWNTGSFLSSEALKPFNLDKYEASSVPGLAHARKRFREVVKNRKSAYIRDHISEHGFEPKDFKDGRKDFSQVIKGFRKEAGVGRTIRSGWTRFSSFYKALSPVLKGIGAGAAIAYSAKRVTSTGTDSMTVPAGVAVGGAAVIGAAGGIVYNSVRNTRGLIGAKGAQAILSKNYYTPHAAKIGALWGGASVLSQEAFGSPHAAMVAQAKAGRASNSLNTEGLGLGAYYAYNRART